jgi:outer membrane protein assembly factor BamB
LHKWKHEGYRSLQPLVVGGDSILLPTGDGAGTRRIRVSQSDDTWTAEEQWTSRKLKPDFNDLVVYQSHAYGFDGAIVTCIDLETGESKWKSDPLMSDSVSTE